MQTLKTLFWILVSLFVVFPVLLITGTILSIVAAIVLAVLGFIAGPVIAICIVAFTVLIFAAIVKDEFE